MIYKRSVTRKVLNIQLILGSNMEIRNDNDRRLWFRIKSIDKKLDNLIGVLDWDIKSTEQKNTFNNLFDFE